MNPFFSLVSMVTVAIVALSLIHSPSTYLSSLIRNNMQKVHAGLELAKQQVRYVWQTQKIPNCCMLLIGLEALQAELLMVGLIHTVWMHKYLTLLHSTYERYL